MYVHCKISYEIAHKISSRLILAVSRLHFDPLLFITLRSSYLALIIQYDTKYDMCVSSFFFFFGFIAQSIPEYSPRAIHVEDIPI